ncbi:MAG: aminoglycoside phosphotransferase family protein [Arenimonas sp.]
MLTQCSLLESGWHQVEKYCEEVHEKFGKLGADLSFAHQAAIDADDHAHSAAVDPDTMARAAKMGQLFYWLREAAGGSPDLDSCSTGLANALRQIKWNSRAPREVPTDDALASALIGACGTGVQLLSRQQNAYSSTFVSEILDARWPGGTVRRLLAKYEFNRFEDVGGHRGGPAYESRVYSSVLPSVDLTRPAFHGALDRGSEGGTWLFLEFLEAAKRPDDLSSPVEALRGAARWIAHFHESAPRADFLQRYDASYYGKWAARTSQFARPWLDRFGWLEPLLERAPDLLEQLTGAATTVIHGEFTPHNLLVRDGAIFPVDWESAAIGAGEIDLAALSDGWPSEIVAACEREYVAARWPLGAPNDFGRRLALARLYWALRWIGNSSEAFPAMFRAHHRIQALEPIARSLGVTTG